MSGYGGGGGVDTVSGSVGLWYMNPHSLSCSVLLLAFSGSAAPVLVLLWLRL